MPTLLETLNEFAKEIKATRKRNWLEYLVEYRDRIVNEMMDSSDRRGLPEYFGFNGHKDTEPKSDKGKKQA